MRPLAFFPFLCALAAFVLSMLCIFAGSKVGFLENVDILTLNTSMLGQGIIKTSTGSTTPSWLASLEASIQGDINGLINDIAKKLNIHDYYSAYLLDYCEGYYTPSPISNTTSHPSKNTTFCSDHTGLFAFDATAILKSELKTGVSLDDLKWPHEFEDAMTLVKTASSVMYVLYCVGAAFAGLAFLSAIYSLAIGHTGSLIINVLLDITAFVTLGIASAIETVIVVKIVNAADQYGSTVGIAAYKGTTFLGMTWAATSLMLAASVAWCVACCGRRRSKKEQRM